MRLLMMSFILCACATTTTGRNQLRLMPESQMASLGNQSYEQMRKTKKVSTNARYVNYVNCVTEAVLKGNGRNAKEWKVTVFEDESANAFALPGNNIGVHTGILKLASDQAELAAVIGHEIAHVDLHHGNERVSQNLLIQGGLVAGQLVLSQGENKNRDQLILASLGLGAQFGILLPFSRSHETEADLLGMQYMAKAGFNPEMASSLWVKMNKGGSNVPEFMSTHPSSQSRIDYLKKEAVKYQATYQAVTIKPQCQL
jgi:predicted Zn-dependent protease